METTNTKPTPINNDDRFSFRDFMIAFALVWVAATASVYWFIAWLAS